MSLPPINLPPITGSSREQCDYALGAYIGCWGDVEAAMAEVLRKLIGSDMTTCQIVIRALGDMRAQREAAAELGRHRLSRTESTALERLLARVKAGATRRNRIIHGKWCLHLQVGRPPNPKPLTAKSAKWYRIYDPPQQDELRELYGGKNQKLNAAYRFWPEQIAQYAQEAKTLAKDLREFTAPLILRPVSDPQPIEW